LACIAGARFLHLLLPLISMSSRHKHHRLLNLRYGMKKTIIFTKNMLTVRLLSLFEILSANDETVVGQLSWVHCRIVHLVFSYVFHSLLRQWAGRRRQDAPQRPSARQRGPVGRDHRCSPSYVRSAVDRGRLCTSRLASRAARSVAVTADTTANGAPSGSSMAGDRASFADCGLELWRV